MERQTILSLIEAERAYQDAKHGSIKANPHTDEDWYKYTIEELNEALEAARIGETDERFQPNIHLLKELIQSAAVIFAWIEERFEAIPQEHIANVMVYRLRQAEAYHAERSQHSAVE